MAGMNELAVTQVNPYATMYRAPGYTQGYVTGAVDNPATAITPAPQTNPSNPYGLYQAPGYVSGQITGQQPTVVQPALVAPAPVYQAPQQMYQAPGYVQGQVTGAYTPESVQALRTPEPQPQTNPYANMYQATGYTPGQVTGTIAPVSQPMLTRPEPQPQANPYANMYQAPGYTPGEVTQAPPAPVAPVSTVQKPSWTNPNVYASPDANVIKKPVLNANSPIFQGKNKPLYDQMVAAVKAGAKYDPTDELDFYKFAQDTTGTSKLPSQQSGLGTAANPLSAYAKQNIIPLNKTMHDYWVKTTNPANPNDPNAFAQWADVNNSPLNGISAQEQFAAFKEAKAAGATPVAPTAPVATPAFSSTGAVKIPTATVAPVKTGYTVPAKTTAPSGPSQPGYVAPTGRVYTNWTPKRKV